MKSTGSIIIAPGEATFEVFESSGTWTKPNNVRAAWVRLVGGGGSGGGTLATGSGESAEGGGGGGGGYAESIILADALGETESVTVGAGASGASAGQNGQDGGTSEFGELVSATGGRGGQAGSPIVTANGANRSIGGRGGRGLGGDMNVDGSSGGTGSIVNDNEVMKTGNGGASPMGGIISSSAASSFGLTGRDYGGGSTGASVENSSTSARGSGDGGDGVVIVATFF